MRKKVLILPCGGLDYDKPIPSFLQETLDKSKIKLFHSIEHIELDDISKIIIILFENKNTQFQIDTIRHYAHLAFGPNNNKFVQIEIIKPTDSVVETVYSVTKNQIDSEIYIKDFDDSFELSSEEITPNTVYIYSLNEGGISDVEKKSYVQVDSINTILNIVEKDVISSNFCVGFYSFESSDYFNQVVEALIHSKKLKNLFISHIIHYMILHGKQFTACKVRKYIDWGSQKLWNIYLDNENKLDSKTRKLFVFGCSHSTWYSPPEDGEEKDAPSWGRLLAKKLDLEYFDMALPSQGIKNILNTFMIAIINNQISKDDVVIFNASYPGRTTLNWLLSSKFGDGDGMSPFRTPDNLIHNQGFAEECARNGFEVKWERVYYEWLVAHEFVLSILDKIGCKYYQWQIEDRTFLQLWYSKICSDDVEFNVLPNNDILSRNLINPPKPYESWWKWNMDNNIEADTHLSRKGHFLFAEYLYKMINNDLI